MGLLCRPVFQLGRQTGSEYCGAGESHRCRYHGAGGSHERDPHLKATRRLLWVSGILFVIALATPYRPQRQPLISQVHVGSAAMTGVCFMVCVTVLSYYVKKDGGRGNYLPVTLTVMACCAVTFCILGIVSSALEVYFVVGCAAVLYQMHRRA